MRARNGSRNHEELILSIICQRPGLQLLHRHVFVEYLNVSRPVEKNSLAVIVQGSIPFNAKRVAPAGSTPPADVVEEDVATVALLCQCLGACA